MSLLDGFVTHKCESDQESYEHETSLDKPERKSVLVYDL